MSIDELEAAARKAQAMRREWAPPFSGAPWISPTVVLALVECVRALEMTTQEYGRTADTGKLRGRSLDALTQAHTTLALLSRVMGEG